MDVDVGCGDKKHGDVGLDLTQREGVDIVADAHHLPIRGRASERTACFTVLEHLDKPYAAIKELERITSGVITVRYDRFFSIYNFMGVGHLNLQACERFIRLPRLFFLFWHTLFEFRPARFLLRRAHLLGADTYEKEYRRASY